MSKSCTTQEEAKATQDFYKSKKIETYIKEYNGKYLIYKIEDNKVLKSINWKKPNYDGLIE